MGDVIYKRGSVVELCCNLDDMTGEDIGFAVDIMLKGGALDVWTSPIYMKKNRPAVLLTCLCASEEAPRFARLMLEHTTTLGVREKCLSRYVLERETVTRQTSLGPVRFKQTALPDGTIREKPEYNDISRLAQEHNLSLEAVREILRIEE